MRKVHGFFCRTKKTCKSALTLLAIEAKTMQKVHWFFLPDKKKHAKVH
jgi:hypothetical protein